MKVELDRKHAREMQTACKFPIYITPVSLSCKIRFFATWRYYIDV